MTFSACRCLPAPTASSRSGVNESRPDYDFADGVTFHVFELARGTAVSRAIPNLQGETDMTLHVRRDGDTLHIQAEGLPNPGACC